MALDARLRLELFEVGLDGGDEPLVLQRRWAEVEDQSTQAVRGESDRLLELGENPQVLRVAQASTELLEAERGGRDDLEAVVVDARRDPPSLALLRAHEVNQDVAMGLSRRP